MPISIDDVGSWPAAVTHQLHEALPMLRAYQERRAIIDREWERRHEEPLVRLNPTRNPYRKARDHLAAEIDRQIAGSSLMAWHCTRLCPDEVAAVLADGMFLLSPETFSARVQRRLDAGDISSNVAERLRAANQAADPHRVGQLWFVLTRKLLTDSGIDDLLGYWGGEALYNSHERDAETGPVLKALGKPCIVAMAIPHSAIRTYGAVGMNIVRTFELTHDLHDENPPDCEGHTRRPVPPEQVLRVATADDAEFVDLTRRRN